MRCVVTMVILVGLIGQATLGAQQAPFSVYDLADYRLTPEGRRRLEAERKSWKRVSLAVNRVLDALS